MRSLTPRSGRGRLLMAAAGALLYAVGVNCFAVPARLYTGGLLGAAQLIRTLLYRWAGVEGGYDFSGILFYALNIPLFLLAFRSMGRVFFRNALIGTTACTLFLSALPVLSGPLIDDTLASCLLGGTLTGLGAGVLLTAGGSSGGLDLLGLWLAKRGGALTIGRFSLLFNAALYALCGLLLGVPAMLYSILYAVFSAVVLDRAYQQSINAEVLIFTKDHAGEITRYITQHLSRGVTAWEARGAYTGEAVHALYACLSKYEIGDLREALHRIDPRAFYTVREGIKISGNFIRRLS